METIMKMDNDNLYLTRYDDMVVEMKEEKEDLILRERNPQAMENEVGIRMEDGDSRDWEERENGAEKIKEDLPSVDDVCPICFDGFTIPCRSNCGHWFCASCILQFWRFKSSINPCKCPLCCRQIVKLEPQVPQTIPQADDSVELLKKVRQYNGLYITGLLGAVHRVQAFPLLLGRIFRVLLEPDSLKCIHFITRLLGWCLALLYERGEFEFMPSGGLGIQRMFNLCGSVVVVVLFSIGAVYRWMLRRRVRRLGQAWDA